MIIEKTGTGATIEEAFENAKLLLGAPEEVALQQEVLSYPKKKLFGLKTEPAKIRVWYEIADEVKKPAAKPVQNTAKPIQNVAAKPAQNTAAKPAQQPAKPAQKPAVNDNHNAKKPVEQKAAKAPEKAAPEKAAPEKKPAAAEVKPEVKETKVPYEISENDKAANYLKMIINGMGIENCTVSAEKIAESGECIYNVSCGDGDGSLIGRRGETLDAIQYLLRLSVNKGIDEDKHNKVSVNVGNYREKRSEVLKSLAAKSARQVLKYGRNVALEPMNPYERRIIHTAVQGIEGVNSHSVGSDAARRVVISLEEGVTPTNPSRGGPRRDGDRGSDRGNRNGDRGNRGGDRGNRGGYQKREAYKPSVTREPRKDTAGSLYGKIEVPSKSSEE